MVGNQALPRRERLAHPQEFQALFRGGDRVERRTLLVFWRAAPAGRRTGFAVSRQIQGAVRRNHARRRVREAYRVSRHELPDGVEVVVVARPAAGAGPFADVLADMQQALVTVARRHRRAVRA